MDEKWCFPLKFTTRGRTIEKEINGGKENEKSIGK